MKRGSSLLAVAVLMLAGLPLTAGAVPLTPDSGVFQQTLNNPCVIGNPSCNNPAGFGFTLLPVSPTSPQITVSPTYTVDQIRTLIGGDTFFIGVDISQAPGQGAYTLNSFTVNIGGGGSEFEFSGPQDFTSSGNGFSDFVLKTVDLTSFLDGSASVVFTVNFSNDNGAREQFFLVSSEAPPAPVPEPTTLVLLGGTLAGLRFVRRRYARRDR